MTDQDLKNKYQLIADFMSRNGFQVQHYISVGSGTMYIVKSGDNLSNISKSFYGNPNDYTKITQANNISNPDKIQVGQQLRIPAA